MQYPEYVVATAVAVGQEIQTIRENRRLAAEPPPPPKPGTAPRAPPRAVPIGPAPSTAPMAPRLPQRPFTQALSLEQEISVLQQFGHSDQDILDLPADQRTLAANSAMALGVLPDPAWPNFWSLFRWRARGDGSKAARPVPRRVHHCYLGDWHDQAMPRQRASQASFPVKTKHRHHVLFRSSPVRYWPCLVVVVLFRGRAGLTGRETV